MNLRRLQRHHTQRSLLVTGPSQRAARRGTRVCDPLHPAHAAREFHLSSRSAQFRHGLPVTELTDTPVPIDLLQRLASGPN